MRIESHISAPAHFFEDRLVQRCAACGRVITDSKWDISRDPNPPLLDKVIAPNVYFSIIIHDDGTSSKDPRHADKKLRKTDHTFCLNQFEELRKSLEYPVRIEKIEKMKCEHCQHRFDGTTSDCCPKCGHAITFIDQTTNESEIVGDPDERS